MISAVEKPYWRRSRRCGTSTCVEVAKLGNEFLVRDSKSPGGAHLTFGREGWDAFVAGVKAGNFGL